MLPASFSGDPYLTAQPRIFTLFGSHMLNVQKTTVYFDATDYRRLKTLARARGCTPAQLVREAVARYAASETPARGARSVGAGASRRGDLSERTEDLLAGLKTRR